MSNAFSIAEARNHFAALVHAAEQGEPVEITRRGRPVAVLLSLDEFRKLTERRDFWDAYTALRAAFDFSALNIQPEDFAVRSPEPGRPVDL